MSAARFCLLLLAAALAGCAETKFAVDQSQTATRAPETHGLYKVGNPYQIDGVWYYPALDYNYDETGVASWYGPGFHGNATANGEAYDMNALTAAHKTLPLPSLVRVTNLENGRALVVRINDRGPYAHGRIIDLSRRAAQLLGFEQQGTARVRVQILADESRALAAAAGAAPGPVVAALPGGDPQPKAAPVAVVTSEALPPPAGTTAAPGSTPPAGAKPAAVSAVSLIAMSDPVPTGQVTVTSVGPTHLFIQAGAFLQFQNADRLRAKLSVLAQARVMPVQLGAQRFFRVRLGPIGTVEEGDRLLEQIVHSGHPEARLVVD